MDTIYQINNKNYVKDAKDAKDAHPLSHCFT